MEWIDLKERAPSEQQRVLVWNGIDVEKAFIFSYYQDGEPLWVYDANWHEFGSVTHWMELPLPPPINQ